MSLTFALEQALNGLQYGVFLFLMASGLTLVFGIMNVINLAHGSLFMAGAYAAAVIFRFADSFLLAMLLAPVATFIIGYGVEFIVLRRIYERDHMDQVLVTFGLLLFANRATVGLFGSASQPFDIPPALDFTVDILPDTPYPAFRLVIIGVGLVVALAIYVIIARTRIGAMVRAGASDRVMLSALGIDVRHLYTWMFCISAALAGLAGMLAGPLVSIEPGMGDDMLILAFVVIVIGGIGSIRGALIASIVVGLVEIAGRTTFKVMLAGTIGATAAQSAAPAMASMSIYLCMVAVLFVRPQGLFAARRG
jgi:branched-chain amino acid transport system permease protein